MTYAKEAWHALPFLASTIFVMLVAGSLAHSPWGIALCYGLALMVPWLAFGIFLAHFYREGWGRRHFLIPLSTQGITTLYFIWCAERALMLQANTATADLSMKYLSYAILLVSFILTTHALVIIYKKKQLFHLWPSAIAVLMLLLFCLIRRRIIPG
ncbi:MAG: hypothetical protein ACMUIL_08545 [bacterium]